MFCMFRQLTIDGSTTVTSDIKVLPKNDGENYRLWTVGVAGGVGNVTGRRIGLVC
jgi:hypothetical protein